MTEKEHDHSMHNSASETEDSLREATWTSIIDAVRRDQLREFLEQHSSDQILASYAGTSLNPQASTADLVTLLKKMPASWEDPLTLQVLLAAAAIDGDSDLFKSCEKRCPEKGIQITQLLQSLVYKVPEVFIFLSQLDWGNLGSDRSAAKLFISATLEPHMNADWPIPLRFLYNTNCTPSELDWQRVALNAPNPAFLDFLLKFNPEGVLNYGMLQNLAAGGWNPDVVKKLIDAGADVNLDPPVYPGHDIREVGTPCRPLWTIAFYSSSWSPDLPHHTKTKMESAKLLLEHGADVNLPAHDKGGWSTALQAARQAGNAELIDLYERYQYRGTCNPKLDQQDQGN